MIDWRKLVDTFLPFLVEEGTTRKVVYVLYWGTTAFLAWGFIVTNPVFGWFVTLAPVLLVWLTSRLGLSRVNGLLLGVVLVFALVPAFFLGKFQPPEDAQEYGLEEGPVGMALVALLVFMVWVAAFPTMVDHVDRRYRKNRGLPDPDTFAEYRVMFIRLWMATIVMALVGANFAALLCAVALLYRRRWTAVVAGVACLVFPLVSVSYRGIAWEANVIDVIAAGISAYSWYGAIRNPHWSGGVFFGILRSVLARRP